jgi:ribosomal protein L11 methyltransferase
VSRTVTVSFELGALDPEVAESACFACGATAVTFADARYGCGSGVLGLACAKLGAAEVHCFDIDSQALCATRENALANGVGGVVRVHEHAAELPAGVDVLAANILSGPLCTLAPAFAALVHPGAVAVLAGLMRHEVGDVTDAYSAWFDVEGGGESGDWACLGARRR